MEHSQLTQSYEFKNFEIRIANGIGSKERHGKGFSVAQSYKLKGGCA